MVDSNAMSEPITAPVIHNSSVADYVSLLKPKVMSLVVFSGMCGMLVAPGTIHPLIGFCAMLALGIGAGAAGAVNMWYDRDIDAVMNRTKNRAVPAGRIASSEALTFAIVLSILSVMVMGMAVNWVAGGILAFANLFYGVVYTMWLKRRTPQNIVIGGAAGAFPPMIGWAAVTGDVSLASFVLFAIIFFWTPPHFWALSLFSNEDYRRANVPMLNLVAGDAVTKKQMLVYTIILLPLAVSPYFLGVAGIWYFAAALILGLLFLLAAMRVLKSDELRPARQMFAYSVFYLFALFTALVMDGKYVNF